MMSLIMQIKLRKISYGYISIIKQGPLGGGGRSGALSVTLRAALKVGTVVFVFVFVFVVVLSGVLCSSPSIWVNKTKSIPEPRI